ncbi:MAG: hypothetical protein PHU81_04750 [Acidobacteriota bacterium]|nr:hypothetical protein [Acidobacteriota bacterium]
MKLINLFKKKGWPLAICLVILSGPTRAEEGRLATFLSPANLKPGMTFRLVIFSENGSKLLENGLNVICHGPGNKASRLMMKKKNGGPPFWQWWSGEVKDSGWHRLEIRNGRQVVKTFDFEVPAGLSQVVASPYYWPAGNNWNREKENLYSAWIEALFGQSDEDDSWPNLSVVLKDPEKNFLYNHLGLGEDESDVQLQPDCADNPFVLRGYFAWKLRLPFGFHACSRGSLSEPPACQRWFINEMPGSRGNEVNKFHRLMRLVMDTVHSGTARTALKAEESDYYPLPLERHKLPPGTVFADPYGHTLVIVHWRPQTDDQPGELLAVDAQPDNTIGIKRFWPGNFLFATENVVGQPGFKAFRPIIIKNNQLKLMTNGEIELSLDYGQISFEQLNLQPEDFYNRMEQLINPRPLAPEAVLSELFRALQEQLQVRVASVGMAEKFKKEHPDYIIPMPSGAAIFQSSGPWEDLSTPNRDLRVLIAIDTIKNFPDKVLKHPGLYKIKKSGAPEKIRTGLIQLSDKLANEMKITYRRSDDRPWSLSLKEVMARQEAFEMGYNPNDCVEYRWGAPAGSEEYSTCRRYAPPAQREKMTAVRIWFKKRLHPPT